MESEDKDTPLFPAPATRPAPRDLFMALRPSQWTKNAIVLAAFCFAFFDQSPDTHRLGGADFLTVLWAAFVFCLVSSGVYVFNDIVDIRTDRNHPIKKSRPIAAGRMPVRTAWGLSIAFIVAGLATSLLLPLPYAGVLVAYIIIQAAYSGFLKRLALIDIVVIAAGFVLRAMAGAVVIDVTISPWLLLCTFLLALFLALCKRRHEKSAVSETPGEQRPSLEKYDTRLLDQLIAIVSASTIVAYAMYTLSPVTQEKFGTTALGFTIPFVIFGIFRYLDLVYRHKKGDRPEKILLTDLPLLANIALYGMAVMIILFITQSQRF